MQRFGSLDCVEQIERRLRDVVRDGATIASKQARPPRGRASGKIPRIELAARDGELSLRASVIIVLTRLKRRQFRRRDGPFLGAHAL